MERKMWIKNSHNGSLNGRHVDFYESAHILQGIKQKFYPGMPDQQGSGLVYVIESKVIRHLFFFFFFQERERDKARLSK